MQAENKRLSALRPTAVNTILAESRALQLEGRKLVSLMRGEPDFPTAPHIEEALLAALRAGRTYYPDNRGEPKLREAVAHKLSRDNGLEYAPGSEILITDGATQAIYAALMAVLAEGDGILIPDPIYDAYQSPIRLAGAEPQPIKSSRTAGRFHLTIDALEAARTETTKAILLNTPWNPVGTVFTPSELAQIAQFVIRHDLILISDEIYESITYDNHRHVSPATLPQLRKRCILVNSLSKTYSMTGWRLGYCAAPAQLISAMLLILQQSSRGPATFIQDAGVAALLGTQDHVKHMRDIYRDRREAVVKALHGLPKVDVAPPEGGFFAMVDISRTGRTSDEVRKHLLHHHGVVVAHGRAYGEPAEGTLRVSFASGGDNLAHGLALLREGLTSL
jgi:aspartate/methionine/tyrosine aminotransferase